MKVNFNPVNRDKISSNHLEKSIGTEVTYIMRPMEGDNNKNCSTEYLLQPGISYTVYCDCKAKVVKHIRPLKQTGNVV